MFIQYKPGYTKQFQNCYFAQKHTNRQGNKLKMAEEHGGWQMLGEECYSVYLELGFRQFELHSSLTP